MTTTLPLEILGQHIAVLGKTGSGKTSTEKLAVEQVVAAGFRVCVLDSIKSDWWGITSSADGKRPGLAFKILGGPHGHVPLHSSAGKAIGQLVGNGKLPLSIIDMADFEPGGLQRFFVDFAQSLWSHMRGVIYLVLEEAHEFAPKERAGFGAENMSIHWAKKLATGSRTKGIRLIVASQSVQQLHNRVLGSCETLIAHRLTTSADQEPVLKWLKAANKDAVPKVESSLGSLRTGTAWLCSGEIKRFELVEFPKFSTYDNNKTPTGDATEVQIKTAPVDPEELRSIIGHAVAEAEANDPRRLKAEVARLQRELAAKPAAVAEPDSGELNQAHDQGYQSGFTDGNAAGREQQAKAMAGAAKRIMDALAGADADLGALVNMTVQAPAPPPPKLLNSRATAVPPRANGATGAPRAVPVRPAPRPVATGPGENLPRGERAVLAAVAERPNGCAREQLTVLIGYKKSARDTYIYRLRERGYVDSQGDRILATDAGVAALGSNFEPLPTGSALRQFWLEKLPIGERRLLEILIDSYPDAVSRDMLSEGTGYKKSARDTYLYRLSNRELVDTSRGGVRASEALFG